MEKVVGKQSLGARENQEDAFDIVFQSEADANGDILMMVADGMGGHVAGEIASTVALQAFSEHFVSGSSVPRPRLRLHEAMVEANEAIAQRVAEEPQLHGMGCTLIGALKFNGRLVWASVGDSILFLQRAGALRRLNADHSVYGELKEQVTKGVLTEAEAAAHPRKNALRSALVGNPIPLIDVNTIDFEPGDTVLLATDGIETLGDTGIEEILAQGSGAPLDEVAGALLDAVAAKGRVSQDNTTVVLYRHGGTGHTGEPYDSKWKLRVTQQPPEPRKQAWPFAAAGGAAVVLALIGYFLLGDREEPVATVVTPVPTQDDVAEDASQAEAPGGGDSVGGDNVVAGDPKQPDDDATPIAGDMQSGTAPQTTDSAEPEPAEPVESPADDPSSAERETENTPGGSEGDAATPETRSEADGEGSGESADADPSPDSSSLNNADPPPNRPQNSDEPSNPDDGAGQGAATGAE